MRREGLEVRVQVGLAVLRIDEAVQAMAGRVEAIAIPELHAIASREAGDRKTDAVLVMLDGHGRAIDEELQGLAGEVEEERCVRRLETELHHGAAGVRLVSIGQLEAQVIADVADPGRPFDRLDAVQDVPSVADGGLLHRCGACLGRVASRSLPAHHLSTAYKTLVDELLDLGDEPGRANVGDKLLTLVMSALAGGDHIDHVDALRAGGTGRVLGFRVKAASTVGTFLRSFRWGHVRQLDAVSRGLLGRAWAAGAGPGDGPLTIDLDSTICETYGLQKEGARHHGYSRVRGYHPLLAVAGGTGDVLMARLREGRANTPRGAAHFLRETIGRVRSAGASGQLTMRADSGFYAHAVVATCRAMGVRFSITARQHGGLRALIEAIPADAWTPIPYWIDGGADVAETTYTPFADQPGARSARVIVRRVRPTPGSQLALFADYAYHPFITDREGDLLELEADHRRHAEVENAIRDLKEGVGLDHLPSGRFAANGAWLAAAVMAHNIGRARSPNAAWPSVLVRQVVRPAGADSPLPVSPLWPCPHRPPPTCCAPSASRSTVRSAGAGCPSAGPRASSWSRRAPSWTARPSTSRRCAAGSSGSLGCSSTRRLRHRPSWPDAWRPSGCPVRRCCTWAGRPGAWPGGSPRSMPPSSATAARIRAGTG